VIRILAAVVALITPFISAAAGEARLPIEVYDNLVFLQVRVNRSAPRSFLLDTGTNVSVLNESAAGVLNLLPPRSLHMKIGTGEASVRTGIAKHVALGFGDVELPPAKMLIVALAPLESRIGHEIDGIVGADIFKRYVAAIDYQSNTLTLSDTRAFAYHGPGELLRLRIAGDRPFLKARVNPVAAGPLDATLVIDTGDTSALGFHTPFVTKHGLRNSPQVLIPHLSKGLSGDSRNWRGRVNSLQLGSVRIDGPLATFSEAVSGSEADSSYDGLIGGEILHRFRVVFNYSARVMVIEPNSAFRDPYEADMSGLTLSEAGANFRTVTIDRIDPHSAGAEAGLVVGDVIETIDARATSSMTLDSVQRLLRQDDRKYVLGVKRGTNSLELTIRLHRII
jgi:hypothetical protein